jgi:lantibiotic modifying enzyme
VTLRDDDYLGVADRIGAQLARDALWHGTRCNWTGDSMEFLEGRWQVAHRALGAELYSGTSGVALFLARLSVATGERLYAQVAAAAVEQALSRADSLQPGSRSGLYAGALGVAWAGVHVAAEIDSPRTVEACDRLLRTLHVETLDREGLDVTSGSAGAICALLDLADRSGHDPALAALLHADALRHGERLLATARRDARGISWPGPGQSQGLCGLSHGAAGFAWALQALYRATGHLPFRAAAEEALRYERSWFDPVEQNWPDLRSLDDDPTVAAALPVGGGPRRPSFMSAWCHGAPGIAMARLASSGLGSDEICLAEAAAAARSTAVATRLMLASGQANYSMCHGLAGNADVLVEAARCGVEPGLMDLAHQVAGAGLARHARTGAPWPCGVLGGGETPSLMLGLAGIGHFYLRLHDPTLPTVLIVSLRVAPARSATSKASA